MMDIEDSTDDQYQLLVDAEFPDPKTFLRTLTAVKPYGSNQTAIVKFTSHGMAINWEDKSKTVQCGVSLGASLFSVYELGQSETSFGVSLDDFFKTLAALASIDDHERILSLKYPGPNAEIMLECGVASESVPKDIMYARISTLESMPFTSFRDMMSDARSSFIFESEVMKEIFNDMEWAQGPVTITMVKKPWELSISSTEGRGGKSLMVNIPANASCLKSTSFEIPRVCRKYAAKKLRAAFQNVNVSTLAIDHCHVYIDENGILNIIIILQLKVTAGGNAQHPLARDDHDTSRPEELTVAQFVLLPLYDDEDGNELRHQLDNEEGKDDF